MSMVPFIEIEPQGSVIFTMFLIFFGAAILATLALYARQAILVSYIALGVLLGPMALDWIDNAHLVEQISDIGIMFLLFLLGINLPPQKLKQLLRETTLVTLLSALLLMLVGFIVAIVFGFTYVESLVIGVAMTLSSTIIGLKLLPTTVLHHLRTGEVMTSILLLQDVLAIGILVMLEMTHATTVGNDISLLSLLLPLLWLPTLFVLAYAVERLILSKLIQRFDQFQEYMFLLAIGWCLAMAQLAETVGLSYEIGAFIAGVALAHHPISAFLAERLKPLRDFFLIMFFFSIGAGFTLANIGPVIVPALLLAGIALGLKPWLFTQLLKYSGEDAGRAKEVGMRLGQMSEFSLLIAMLAMELAVIGSHASDLIQLATVITLAVSPYLIMTRYPSPMAISDHLRRD
ncbi:MAG: cation:proton antiporter [Mariprofundaceae bacterium]|nr:cation:proton antiporter [Mariprofundaceae bacterium]